MTREEWLNEAARRLAPRFDAISNRLLNAQPAFLAD